MQPDRIKELRKVRGWYEEQYEAQETFARILGVSRRTYQKIEAGETKPKPLQLAILQELAANKTAGDLKDKVRKLTEALKQYPLEKREHWNSKPKPLPENRRKANEIAGIRAVLSILFSKPASLLKD